MPRRHVEGRWDRLEEGDGGTAGGGRWIASIAIAAVAIAALTAGLIQLDFRQERQTQAARLQAVTELRSSLVARAGSKSACARRAS